MDLLSQTLALIDDGMYAYILVGLLLVCGVYFTIKTKAVQIRRIPDMFKYMLDKTEVKGKKAMSSFEALMISTGSRVGTGNIAGIATAIAVGGPGSVFWMWVLTLVVSSSAFVESTLAQIWKRRGSEGSFRGGPAYYIEQALGSKAWGSIFAVALMLAFAFGFNGLQSFNVASSLDYYFAGTNIDLNHVHIIIGLILAVLTAFTIFRGMKAVGYVSAIIVPFMAFLYIGIALVIIVFNVGCFGAIFNVVFSNAFSAQSIFAGTAGTALLYGAKRGLLSNEAGMGSAPNAAACASTSHPVKQGLAQSLSAYINTFFICTSSAFMVLVFFVSQPELAAQYNGMPLVQMALSNSIGEVGIHILNISIFFFAFSSLIGNYGYAEANLKFITNKKGALTLFRFLCLLPIFTGALANIDIAWSIADIFMGIMAMINIVSILLLGKWAIAALKDYDSQKKQGLDPVFYAENIPDLPATECWHKPQ